MLSEWLLVLWPWLTRGLYAPSTHPLDIALSSIPALLCLGGSRLQWLVKDEEDEHIGRHVFYASSFALSAIAVNWRSSDAEEDIFLSMLVYFVSTGTLLWWFAVSHALENMQRPKWLYTHQGDTLVLPVTLLAISTFVNDVPDEMFRFSRSVVFFVPVVVGWVVVILIAYAGFATSKTTTLGAPGYSNLANQGLLVATSHLLLIEVQASPVAYFLFAACGAIFAQLTYRTDAPPELRERHLAGSVFTSTAVGAAASFVLRPRFGVYSYVFVPYACVAYTLSVRRACGRRWALPASLFASLFTVLSLRFLDPPSEENPSLYALDAIIAVPTFCISFLLIAFVAPAVFVTTPPPSPPPFHSERPQDDASACSVTGLSKCVQRVLGANVGPSSGKLSREALHKFYDVVNPDCPHYLRGVWWMEGNLFPMELLCVHRLKTWKEGTAVMENAFDITYSTDVSGWITYLMSLMTYTKITVVNREWIRTDSWRTPLRLLAHTYWLYRVDDDTMIRLVYNTSGRVVWRYKMKKISRSIQQTTFHYSEFVRSPANKAPFFLRLSD